MNKIVKKIKNFFRNCYQFIDKIVITPITKLIYLITNKYEAIPIGPPNIAAIQIYFPLLVLITLINCFNCLVNNIYIIIHRLENISCRNALINGAKNK